MAVTTANGTRPRRQPPEPQASANGHGATRPPAPDVAAWPATASLAQVKAASRAVLALLSEHRDLLSPAILAGLRELNASLSEQRCPWTTRELDAARDKLNAQCPDYEHWYIRSGSTVTWCDRKKEPTTAPA